MTIKQWVNLPQEQDHVGKGIDSLDALGRKVRVRLKFTQNVSGPKAGYTLFPRDSNARYSDAEKGRNNAFQTLQDRDLVHIKDGEAIAEVILPVSGGDSYEVKGYYRNEVVTSDVIETRRRLYYASVAVDGVEAPDLASVEAAFYNEDKKFFIELVRLEKQAPDLVVDDVLVNVNVDEWVSENSSKLRLEKHQAHAFIVVWVKRIIRLIKNDLYDFRVSPDLGDETAAEVTFFFKNPTCYPLLRGVTPGDDQPATWLEGLRGSYVEKIEGKKTRTGFEVPLAQVTRVDESFLITVEQAQLKPYRTNQPCERKVSVSMTVVQRSDIGGLVLHGEQGRIILVATRGEDGNDLPQEDVLRFLTHEIGHAIGLASNGPRRAHQPDKHEFFYEDKGGVGPHCSKPAQGQALSYSDDEERWYGQPGCVMFGSIAGHGSPSTFCDLCERHIRKLDLSKAAFNAK